MRQGHRQTGCACSPLYVMSSNFVIILMSMLKGVFRAQSSLTKVPALQPAYQDADSTSTAMQAAAPIGVTEFRTEKLVPHT